jgi:hypothetical protein
MTALGAQRMFDAPCLNVRFPPKADIPLRDTPISRVYAGGHSAEKHWTKVLRFIKSEILAFRHFGWRLGPATNVTVTDD